MNLKEIVYCYVSQTIPMPNDFSALKKSFVENQFTEKQVNSNKWVYKRGTGFSLEFNYQSETMEMQVILEKVDGGLKISVGNWGFPFEPLMMKKRFQKNLDKIVKQISVNGVLTVDAEGSQKLVEQAQNNKKFAILFVSLFVVGLVVYEVYFGV